MDSREAMMIESSSMVQPSAVSTVAFIGVVAAVAAMLMLGTRAAGPALREAPAYTRRWVQGTVVALAAWLAVTAWVSASGVLEAPGVPPPALLFIVACNLVAIVFAFSRAGMRLVAGLPIAALVGFQAFRLPLELVLHRWYVEGVLPVQMTYAGRNFDIVSGLLGLGVGLWLWKHGPSHRLSRPLVWLFNLVGLGLLATVATIAVLSSPLPTRVFMNEPAVRLVFYAPYGWIVPMCVSAALAGHLLVFRWLWRTRTR